MPTDHRRDDDPGSISDRNARPADSTVDPERRDPRAAGSRTASHNC